MRRKFKALSYLSYTFFKHILKKIFLLKSAGYAAFKHAYRDDRIFAITAAQRTHFNAFSHCYTCRCCDEVCPELKEDRDFLAPSYVVGSFSRLLTSYYLFSSGKTCTECTLCEKACPQNVPIKEIINLMRRHVAG